MAPRHIVAIVITCVCTMLISSKLTEDLWNHDLQGYFAWSIFNQSLMSLSPDQVMGNQNPSVQGTHTYSKETVDESGKGPANIQQDGKQDMPKISPSSVQSISITPNHTKEYVQDNPAITNGSQEIKTGNPKSQNIENPILAVKGKDIPIQHKTDTNNKINKPSSCKAEFVNFTEEDDGGSFRKAGPMTYVYTAYYDDRPEAKHPLIKVIAMSSENVTMFCNLWYGNKGYSKVTTVKAEIIVPILRYSAVLETVILLCSVNTSDPDIGIPRWVVFSETPCGPPTTELPISNLHARSPQYNFTVCLHKAFIHRYNNTAQFVEWVEVNRIFGAEHFLVYNFSGQPNLLPYIQYYIREGIMEYRNWPVEQFQWLTKYMKGQNGVMCDCTYRYMFRTKYMIMTDIDEFVVPRKHNTWNELIRNSPCNKSSAIGIRNVFFRLQYDINPMYTKDKSMSRHHLNTLAHTQRKNFSWPCGIRSKIMIQPDHALYPATHMSGMPNECCMPDHLAQLFHYRWFNDTIYQTWNARDYFKRLTPYYPYFENTINEFRMYKIKDKLVQNVAKVYKDVDGT